MKKPRVFISYAHMDARKFTERLAFDLERLMDVFWDIKLQAGEFPEYLKQEIMSREFFVAVMTPYSESEDSWCRRELRIAEENNRHIALVRIYEKHHDILLEEKYTYADFTKDYDQGFRRLTGMILGEPVSSWEYLGSERNVQTIFDSFAKGIIPGVVAKQVGEWVIVDMLWREVKKNLVNQYGDIIFIGEPRTPEGILEEIPSLLRQLPDTDSMRMTLVFKARDIIQPYAEKNERIRESDHFRASRNTIELIHGVRFLFNQLFAYGISLWEAEGIKTRYHSNVAEKTREFLRLHSRLSRYLY